MTRYWLVLPLGLSHRYRSPSFTTYFRFITSPTFELIIHTAFRASPRSSSLLIVTTLLGDCVGAAARCRLPLLRRCLRSLRCRSLLALCQLTSKLKSTTIGRHNFEIGSEELTKHQFFFDNTRRFKPISSDLLAALRLCLVRLIN